jgi:haloalkane dehalogenase
MNKAMETVRADFPYESRYAEVKGSKMHYAVHGEGDPILFLHGQPTWSYLWRNVMPELEGKGQLIALDLIGYGKSDKPDIAYEMTDHIAYIEAFIETMGLKNLTLVIHDWGSFFGFHYAMNNQDNVKGIAFMEAILMPIPGYEAFDPDTREFFTNLRASQENAEDMMVNKNMFIEGVLPAMICRDMTEDEMNGYREPWANPEDRKILCKFPQNLVIGGEPKGNYDMLVAYLEKLQKSDMPKLMIETSPGLLINEEVAAWAKENLPNLTSAHVGDGLHYVQEDQPKGIGQAIRSWMDGL